MNNSPPFVGLCLGGHVYAAASRRRRNCAHKRKNCERYAPPGGIFFPLELVSRVSIFFILSLSFLPFFPEIPTVNIRTSNRNVKSSSPCSEHWDSFPSFTDSSPEQVIGSSQARLLFRSIRFCPGFPESTSELGRSIVSPRQKITSLIIAVSNLPLLAFYFPFLYLLKGLPFLLVLFLVTFFLSSRHALLSYY